MSAGRCIVLVDRTHVRSTGTGAGDLDPRPPPGRITGVERALAAREAGEHEAVRRPGGDPDGSGVGSGGPRAVPVAGPVVEGPGRGRPLGGDRSVVAVRPGTSGDRIR